MHLREPSVPWTSPEMLGRPAVSERLLALGEMHALARNRHGPAPRYSRPPSSHVRSAIRRSSPGSPLDASLTSRVSRSRRSSTMRRFDFARGPRRVTKPLGPQSGLSAQPHSRSIGRRPPARASDFAVSAHRRDQLTTDGLAVAWRLDDDEAVAAALCARLFARWGPDAGGEACCARRRACRGGRPSG